MTVARLPFAFDENELELWNVEFWQLKKKIVKTLQIGLHSVFLNLPIKHLQEMKRKKRNLIVKEK